MKLSESPYMYFFNTEKASDAVVYASFMGDLFKLGINGNSLVCMYKGYTDLTSVVKMPKG